MIFLSHPALNSYAQQIIKFDAEKPDGNTVIEFKKSFTHHVPQLSKQGQPIRPVIVSGQNTRRWLLITTLNTPRNPRGAATTTQRPHLISHAMKM